MAKRRHRAVIPKVSTLVKLWHFHLRNVALDAGLMRKNTDYARYIILGKARTGSNYLRGLLNSHRQIIAFGELFRHYGEIGWDFSHPPQTERMASLIQGNPVQFLETSVYGNLPKHMSAVGFKIFYNHAHTDAWEPIWGYLSNDKDIKVIHIKRKNVLKTHFSRRKAETTSVWVRQYSGPIEPIHLSYEECLDVFVETREKEAEYDAFFADHDKVEVIYEQLSRDYPNEMRRIQDFLGVDYEEVKPTTLQQIKEPLNRAIANYDELKERFAGTPWEEYFEV